MVENFVLPEGRPGAAQNAVSHATCSPFEPPHDCGPCGTRFEDCVDVIGHDHPRAEIVEPAHGLAKQESVHNHGGYSRILQPEGTGPLAVEPLVFRKERQFRRSSWRGMTGHKRRWPVPPLVGRKGAGKAPGNENGGLLWNPVREVSAGEGHLLLRNRYPVASGILQEMCELNGWRNSRRGRRWCADRRIAAT